MNTTTMRRSLALVIAVAGLGFVSACSKPAPEERLIEAGEAVSETQDRLESINEEIASHEDAIERLRNERQRARATLMTLEERLERRATDLAIFRAAQSALLDEPALRDAVVLARVEDGVVTLSGSVSNKMAKQTATDIVAAVPGVESTVVRIQIVDQSDSDDS